jgi:hypothetical protein
MFSQNSGGVGGKAYWNQKENGLSVSIKPSEKSIVKEEIINVSSLDAATD